MPTTTITCKTCKGTGVHAPYRQPEDTPCEQCKGSGKTYHRSVNWEPLEGDFALATDGQAHFEHQPGLMRCAVPGGWLVQESFSGMDGGGVGLAFIPDPDHTWEP